MALGMSKAAFLRQYWQKRPLLVRQAFPAFEDPITPDELAGLSCEDGVESRIVRERGGARPWEVTWGPHPEKRFARLPERGWTLLVQEVNRHVPAAALLLEHFSFLPNVRVDDVMVSFAAPGGSVGPHLDSYDVFLVQGVGKRRWKFHTTRTTDATLRPGLDLRVLERFEPHVDEVLEPGDMLYLPPGFAHHGVAVTPCMTYSIGFRSPNAGEMWTSFAAHAARSSARAALLLDDPPLSPSADPGAIPPAMLARVRRIVRSLTNVPDDAIDRWFAGFATELAPGHRIEPPRRAPRPAPIFARLRRGDRVARSEEGRWAHLPRRGGGVFLYVGGVEIAVERAAVPVARALCAARRFDGAELATLADKTAAARALVTGLFAMGALAFVGRPAARASAR